MGAKTLYHPVSMNVIRGAAEFGGFEFSKMRQTANDMQKRTAHYITEVLKMPQELRNSSLWDVAGRLNGCYSKDVCVTAIWYTRSHKTMIELKAWHPDSAPEHDADLVSGVLLPQSEMGEDVDE